MSNKKPITIILIDDIRETIESIQRLLAFEPDFEVVGIANNGRSGVELAQQHKPDVAIFDINMPDMDGLEAASIVGKNVPRTAKIMMSVQSDADYMQKAMRAGARFFLVKPVDMDQLYNTIRMVYEQHAQIREQVDGYSAEDEADFLSFLDDEDEDDTQSYQKIGNRTGHIVTVYSPTGGVGTSTIALNLAMALNQPAGTEDDDNTSMFGRLFGNSGISNKASRNDKKILLIDADISWGILGIALNLKHSKTLDDFPEDTNQVDIKTFTSAITKHQSGVDVLFNPPNLITGVEFYHSKSEMFVELLKKFRYLYDYIVIDTSVEITDLNLHLFEYSPLIALVLTPNLNALRDARSFIEFLVQAGIGQERIMPILNHAQFEIEDKALRKLIPTPSRIEQFLKRKLSAAISHDNSYLFTRSISKGKPLLAQFSDEDKDKLPFSEFLQLAEKVIEACQTGTIGDLTHQIDMATPSDVYIKMVMAETQNLLDRRQILETEPLLLHLAKRIDQLAGGTAHNIRSPLGTAKTTIDNKLFKQKIDNEDIQTILELIDTALLDANSFLNISLIEPGSIEENNIREMVEEVNHFLSLKGHRQAELSNWDFTLKASRNSLRLAIFNILHVAVDWPGAKQAVKVNVEDETLIFTIAAPIPDNVMSDNLIQLGYISSVDQTGTRLYVANRILRISNIQILIQGTKNQTQIIINSQGQEQKDWTLGELEKQETENENLKQKVQDFLDKELDESEINQVEERYREIVNAFCARMISHLQDLTSRMNIVAETLEDNDFIRKASHNTRYCELLIRTLYLTLKGIELNPSRINVKKLLDTACELLEHKANNANIIMVVDAPDIFIHSDRLLLLQAIMNLGRNAIDATGEGTLMFHAHPEDDYLVIEVLDDGDGIAPELYNRIGKLGFTTKSQGYGMGLHSVYSIVEKLNGTISFVSEVRMGTLFQIELPYELKDKTS